MQAGFGLERNAVRLGDADAAMLVDRLLRNRRQLNVIVTSRDERFSRV